MTDRTQNSQASSRSTETTTSQSSVETTDGKHEDKSKIAGVKSSREAYVPLDLTHPPKGKFFYIYS